MIPQTPGHVNSTIWCNSLAEAQAVADGYVLLSANGEAWIIHSTPRAAVTIDRSVARAYQRDGYSITHVTRDGRKPRRRS